METRLTVKLIQDAALVGILSGQKKYRTLRPMASKVFGMTGSSAMRDAVDEEGNIRYR